MVNLLGDLWDAGEPRWADALRADPGVKLHLYGKKTPAPGRKMGHLTVRDAHPDAALARADRRAEAALGERIMSELVARALGPWFLSEPLGLVALILVPLPWFASAARRRLAWPTLDGFRGVPHARAGVDPPPPETSDRDGDRLARGRPGATAGPGRADPDRGAGGGDRGGDRPQREHGDRGFSQPQTDPSRGSRRPRTRCRGSSRGQARRRGRRDRVRRRAAPRVVRRRSTMPSCSTPCARSARRGAGKGGRTSATRLPRGSATCAGRRPPGACLCS